MQIFIQELQNIYADRLFLVFILFSNKHKTRSSSVHLVPQCKERESKEKSKSSSEFRHQRGKSIVSLL